MEKAKAKRTGLRTSLTKSLNKLATKLGDNSCIVELKAEFAVAEKRMSQLTEVSDNIIDQMTGAAGTTEAELQKE